MSLRPGSVFRLATLLFLGLASGCGDTPPAPVQCMSMGATSDIVANSALVTIQIYAQGVACDNNVVAANAPAPIFSRSFTQGQPITLDVPPGKHTVALASFSDAGGTVQTGAGCVPDADFQPGQQVCIDLSVVEVDATVPNNCVGSSCPCTPQQDDCPVGEYCAAIGQCAPGCKTNADCTMMGAPDLGASGDGGLRDGGAPASALFCDPSRHTCVQCVTNADCTVGTVCSPMGTCVQGCDLSKGKDCSAGNLCCNMMCLPNNSTTNCGTTCGNIVNCASTVQNATSVSCASGVCAFTCKPGFADCDGNPVNGCETNLTSAATCGSSCLNVVNCGSTVKNASAIGCTAGVCTFTCSTGFGNCDGNASNGCETNISVPTSCGTTCGNKVDCTSTVQNATAISCSSGSCSFTCNTNMGDCDGNKSNGCETNLLTSTANCGTCGRGCSTTNVTAGGLTCSGGLCTTALCSGSFANCSTPAAPAPDDGCETNLDDPNHCGSCNKVCMLSNAVSACPSGTCTVGSCNSGYMNCDGQAANGCECQTGAPNNNQCCGTGCQTVHVNGPNGTMTPGAFTGQNYFDCYPLGVAGTETTKCGGGFDATVATNNPQQMALNARSVFQFASSGGGTGDANITCGSNASCINRHYVDSAGKNHCITWCYSDDTGPMTCKGGFVASGSACVNLPCTGGVPPAWCGVGGHVFDNVATGGGSASCFCPWPTDPTWN